MEYVLIWCEQLAIFALHKPHGLGTQTFSEPDLRKEFANCPLLLQWVEFTKSNPNREVAYDFLPPSSISKGA